METRSVGSGHIDLFGYLRGDTTSGRAGIGVDYEHRIAEELSAFGTANIWGRWGGVDALEYDLMFGLRGAW